MSLFSSHFFQSFFHFCLPKIPNDPTYRGNAVSLIQLNTPECLYQVLRETHSFLVFPRRLGRGVVWLYVSWSSLTLISCLIWNHTFPLLIQLFFRMPDFYWSYRNCLERMKNSKVYIITYNWMRHSLTRIYLSLMMISLLRVLPAFLLPTPIFPHSFLCWIPPLSVICYSDNR